MPRNVDVQLRHGTAAQWTTANPILDLGELGVETDTSKLKIGNGATVWNSLAYVGGGGGSGSTTPAASTIAEWDANVNMNANAFLSGINTITSAAGTTTLSIASAQVQVVTGTTTQTIKLPSTNVPAGMEYFVVNQSTGAVTVQSSGANTIAVQAANSTGMYQAQQSGPSAQAHWAADINLAGKNFVNNNSLTLAGTDGTTMTFPTTSATIARTDAAQTFTGVQTMTSPSLTTPTIASIVNTGTLTLPTTTSVVDAEQFCTLTSAYTLTSQTAAQKLFNTSTNGAVTLPVGTYFFECFFSLSALNTATSSVFGWTLGAGTATIAGILWESEASSSALTTPASPVNTVNTAANVALVAANTTGIGWAKIWGKVRITGAGTVIPQVSLNTAAAAIVGVDSYFRIWQGSTSGTVTTVGTWS